MASFFEDLGFSFGSDEVEVLARSSVAAPLRATRLKGVPPSRRETSLCAVDEAHSSVRNRKYIGSDRSDQARNPSSVLTAKDVELLRENLKIPDSIKLRVPDPDKKVDNPREGWFTIFELFFYVRLRFLFHPLLSDILYNYDLAPTQLMQNSLRIALSAVELADHAEVNISSKDICKCFT